MTLVGFREELLVEIFQIIVDIFFSRKLPCCCHLGSQNCSELKFLLLLSDDPVSPEPETHLLPKLLPLVLLHLDPSIHYHPDRPLLHNSMFCNRLLHFQFSSRRLLYSFQILLHNELLDGKALESGAADHFWPRRRWQMNFKRKVLRGRI